MTKRNCAVLTFALFVGVTPLAIAHVREQDNVEKSTKEQSLTPKTAAEKGAKEQSTTEKKPENTVMDTGANFPQAQGVVELRPVANARVTLKLTDTSRAIYEAIGKQAKISVIFDPDYTPRTIGVDLDSVSLQDA